MGIASKKVICLGFFKDNLPMIARGQTMKTITEEIADFFEKQGFVIVVSIDQKGYPSSACKGIIEIDRSGRVYLLDLYKGKTRKNLSLNPHVSITAIDEHGFKGYSLKGKGRIVTDRDIDRSLKKAWEDRITSRLTSRLLKNIRGGVKTEGKHPEALLPQPEYMIAIDVEEIVDLTPKHLKNTLGF